MALFTYITGPNIQTKLHDQFKLREPEALETVYTILPNEKLLLSPVALTCVILC